MPPKRKAATSSPSPPPRRAARRPRRVAPVSSASASEDDGADWEAEAEAKSSAASLSPPPSSPGTSSAPFDDETADERRVRLTKAYIQHVRREAGEEKERRAEEDGADVDDDEGEGEGEMEDVVSHRLLRDAEAASIPRQRRPLAERYRRWATEGLPRPRLCRGHRLSVTCTAVRSDDRLAYSAAKDGSCIEWDVESGRRLCEWRPREAGSGAKSHILGLALSSDGRFLATGGADGAIRVFDTRRREGGAAEEAKEGRERVSAAPQPPPPPPPSRRPPPPLWCEFPAHRSSVTALSFRLSSPQLFSGSADRTVKLFDVAAKAYVETLFGHSQEVTAVHSSDAQRTHSTRCPFLLPPPPLSRPHPLVLSSRCAPRHRLYRQRAVSVGADRTARLWKVVEESQLLFRAEASLLSGAAAVSLDCAALLDDEHFVTGGDDGGLHLWSSQKKRPLQSLAAQHGGHWLVSVASSPYSDVAFSGSSDGFIRAYEWRPHTAAPLQPLYRIPCVGYVNSLSASHSGRFLVAGIGQEHRAGRWTPTVKAAHNGLAIIPLLRDSDAALDPLPGDITHRTQ